MVFPHIVVWGSCFFCCTSSLLLRPPSSSSALLPPSSSLTTTSLTQHLSQQHLSHNISHNNITQTTSHTQRLAHNITQTTSLTTTSRTQHHSHKTSLTTTSHTQHLQHARCLPRGRMYALASSGVGWAPAQIAWQAQHFVAGHRRSLRGRRSTLVLAKGSQCTPWRVWRRLGTGAVRVAGAVLCCAPRGRMYALASSGVGWAPAQISWQVQHFAARQGVGCTPWRRLASAGHRRRFRGRRSTLLLAKGSDVRPGVVWRRLGTGADFVAGAALCYLPRGRMCALASSGVGWAPAQISWQAQYFAACQGVGCTPWRRLASAGHRRSLRGRRSTLLLAKGSDVRPGVADFVAGAALCYLPRGRMYALASSGVGTALCEPPCADFVPGTALCEPPCADFVAGTALCEPPCADFVPGAALCEPPCADFVAGAVQISRQAQHFVNPHVQISWQARYSVNVHARISWQAQHLVNLHA